MIYPSVSIIIPCRNEETFIGKCLDSIIANDFSKDSLEIIVIDGMSEDRTRDIINEYSQQFSFVNLLDNYKKIVPTALNIGIQNANGKIIIRMDAHTTYEKNYVTKCVEYLQNYGADNAGGICVTLPGDDTVMAKSIAMALSHPFGVGNSYFRIGLKEPKYVDTVPFGCYKKEVFDKIGLFHENLIRNQDIEFNLRLKNAGGKILLVPDIVSYYRARSSLKALAKNNFSNGFWVIYSSRFAKVPFSIRHLIPLLFVVALLSSFSMSLVYFPVFYIFSLVLGTYLIAGIYYSLKISLKKGLKFFPILILTFFTLHLSYGFGSCWGICKILSGKILLNKQ